MKAKNKTVWGNLGVYKRVDEALFNQKFIRHWFRAHLTGHPGRDKSYDVDYDTVIKLADDCKQSLNGCGWFAEHYDVYDDRFVELMNEAIADIDSLLELEKNANCYCAFLYDAGR